jgi:hypothetical protein
VASRPGGSRGHRSASVGSATADRVRVTVGKQGSPGARRPADQASTAASAATWPMGVVSTPVMRIRDASHPRRSASSVPTLLTLPARVSRPRGVCSSHRCRRNERPSRHVSADKSRCACACRLAISRRIHPSPQPAPNLRDRLAPAGVFSLQPYENVSRVTGPNTGTAHGRRAPLRSRG